MFSDPSQKVRGSGNRVFASHADLGHGLWPIIGVSPAHGAHALTDLVAAARRFATEAHERIDQRRKYSNQPYQEHLKAVAEHVAGVTDDAEMLAAASPR